MKTPTMKYLKNYCAPNYWIEQIDLCFELNPELTKVSSHLKLRRNHHQQKNLILDGEAMKLISVSMNHQKLSKTQYLCDESTLQIFNPPDEFSLQIENEIQPIQNTQLSGLYVSNSRFFTQCEAEGFRRITYFLDRPDVMTIYKTKIIADAKQFPLLLSNGNLINSGQLKNGKHWVEWEDPFKKPSYLFALVAGSFSILEDSFTTASGCEVALKIYTAPEHHTKCDHAMQSLKNAMQWDEEKFGLEYDLECFRVVAVDDCNMGAMENKSLNIFNSKCILANPRITTDAQFARIEGIVAHEYFHNWTGNRVTCRDWFQLSLKEGLTVFRDQEFSSDMGERSIQRIEDAHFLRVHQFPEDQGPMAHATRPDSFVEINNFYTRTVYEKGAEVIRMIQTLLGQKNFRQGMDLYFERHDGQAVTMDDFIQAMQDASGLDLTQFCLWYSQAGTPQIHVRAIYEIETKMLTLKIKQNCPPTPHQPHKKPLHIPFAIGFLDRSGSPLTPQLLGQETSATNETCLLELKQREEVFHFTGIHEPPIVSLLRDFSAPVEVHFDYSQEELSFLTIHDTNPFSRWDASRRLVNSTLLNQLNSEESQNDVMIQTFRYLLEHADQNPALVAKMLALPSNREFEELVHPIDVDAIHTLLISTAQTIANTLQHELQKIYAQYHETTPYQWNTKSVAKRALKNACLNLLIHASDNFKMAYAQYQNADNMTDRLTAFRALVHTDNPLKQEVIDDFYNMFENDDLVLEEWFAVQAMAPFTTTLETVKSLTQHEKFSESNPNKVRALLFSFALNNPRQFHQEASYQFYMDWIWKLDDINPQSAASGLVAFQNRIRHKPDKCLQMAKHLETLLNKPSLSPDVYEIVQKNLDLQPNS